MNITLAYGQSDLNIDLPVSADVLRPRHVSGLPDEAAAIRAALASPIGAPPLAAQVNRGDRVVVAHSDITRATPNQRLLPVLLAELEAAGIHRENITLLNALGTHRKQTPAELRGMLGDSIVEKYRCLQHDAFDDENLASLGETSSGHPVRLSRTLLEADLKILTGFIEPHFFAGFSGGPKGVLPALAGAESVLTNHGYHMISDPQATWGICEGNPIWEEMLEMALRVSPVFLLNVSLNVDKQITGVFAGNLQAAHRAGREFVRQNAMVPVSAPYDVVITTNSGYPLDQNLYQTVKGMSAASQVVRQGGAIIMAAGCVDGLPDHGQYASLLAEAGSPDAILEMLARPGFSAHDQWQVQIQAAIQKKADVYVYSDGLSDEQIRRALFSPCRDIPTLVKDLVKKHGSRVCVIPDGPLTIAYLQ